MYYIPLEHPSDSNHFIGQITREPKAMSYQNNTNRFTQDVRRPQTDYSESLNNFNLIDENKRLKQEMQYFKNTELELNKYITYQKKIIIEQERRIGELSEQHVPIEDNLANKLSKIRELRQRLKN